MQTQNIEKLKRAGAKKILVQVPEGLKMRAQGIIKKLEDAGLEPLLWCEPCFGACDLPDQAAKLLGCDAILHMAHSDLGLKTDIPVVYEEYRIPFNPIPLLKREVKKLPFRRISLITTLQFIEILKPVKKFLESKGKKVFIGKPECAKYPGQILGCDYSAALSLEKQIDCFLFLGSGLFHPLGLAIKTQKPVLFLDFESGQLKSLEKEKARLEMKRTAWIERAKECESFGVLVSTKPGQLMPGLAEQVKQKLRSKGKTALILAMDEITPSKLLGLNLDCLINCACPRLSDDYELFKKPILNPEDIEKL